MKFGDKLVALRKKSGMSQEALAEKLGVSRQSVSKWESNNTYPETDKIVQIANLFDCSMDDLINDKITDVDQALRSNKNKLNDMWDSLLEFITKTINMFSHMKFSTGLKCIIEMIVSAFLLWLLGKIVCGMSSNIIANLFVFLGQEVANSIHNIIYGVFHLFWFILAVIILIHIFKIRYLNYYVEKEEKKDNNTISTSKEEKIIIRDEKDKPFAFLGVLSTILIVFIKIMAAFVGLGLIAIIVFLSICSIISISLLTTNILFVGSTLSLLSSLIVMLLFLLLCIYFIFSKKINVKAFAISLIAAIVIFGIGLGVCTISFKNFEIIENDKNDTVEELTIDYKDNLVIESPNMNNYTYVIDNNLEDNKIIVKSNINKNMKKLTTDYSQEDLMEVVDISSKMTINNSEYFKLLKKDLKNNKIHSSYFGTNLNNLTIVGNNNTISKLLDNLSKLYLYERIDEESNIKITLHEAKVYFPNGFNGKYDARSDELIYDNQVEDNYKCEKSIENTKWGDKIIFNCNYKEDE